MKKLLLLVTFLVSSTILVLAQDNPAVTPVGDSKLQQQQATCEVHYYYKNHRLIACSGCIWKDQAENVKLSNGTVITNKGEVATHHWTKIQKLKDGEAVNLKGEIIDHKKAHGDM